MAKKCAVCGYRFKFEDITKCDPVFQSPEYGMVCATCYAQIKKWDKLAIANSNSNQIYQYEE